MLRVLKWFAIGLVVLALVLWGALTALYRNRLPDILIMLLVIMGISVPSFVVAALGQLGIVNANSFFGTSLLPAVGWGSIQHSSRWGSSDARASGGCRGGRVCGSWAAGDQVVTLCVAEPAL